jgi:hypothetical protein
VVFEGFSLQKKQFILFVSLVGLLFQYPLHFTKDQIRHQQILTDEAIV